MRAEHFLYFNNSKNLGQRFGASGVHLGLPVAWAAVRSKAVVLILLSFCLLLHLVTYTISSFNQSSREESNDCFAQIVFLLSCSCLCSLSLPCGAKDWSVFVVFVTDEFPGHTHMFFSLLLLQLLVLARSYALPLF